MHTDHDDLLGCPHYDDATRIHDNRLCDLDLRRDVHDMGDNTANLKYLTVLVDDYDLGSVFCADDFDAVRVEYDGRTYHLVADDIVDKLRRTDDDLDFPADNRARRDNLVYEFAVARARYHRCPTRLNLDAADAAADRLNSYHTRHTAATPGDQMTPVRRVHGCDATSTQ